MLAGCVGATTPLYMTPPFRVLDPPRGQIWRVIRCVVLIDFKSESRVQTYSTNLIGPQTNSERNLGRLIVCASLASFAANPKSIRASRPSESEVQEKK